MIGGTCVYVPVCINAIRTFRFFWGLVIIIIITISPPALISWMPFLLADLTENTFLPWCGAAILLASFLGTVLARTLLLLGRTGRTRLLLWGRHVWRHV
jgi:hypothetical protein